MRLLSPRNRERILKKWNEFSITTTRKPPPHHLPLFILGFWGEFKRFFLAFLSIDEEVTSCSSRNESKGPPEPEGDLGWASTKSKPPPSPFRDRAKQKVFKKGAGGLKLIRSWRIQ